MYYHLCELTMLYTRGFSTQNLVSSFEEPSMVLLYSFFQNTSPNCIWKKNCKINKNYIHVYSYRRFSKSSLQVISTVLFPTLIIVLTIFVCVGISLLGFPCFCLSFVIIRIYIHVDTQSARDVDVSTSQTVNSFVFSANNYMQYIMKIVIFSLVHK